MAFRHHCAAAFDFGFAHAVVAGEGGGGGADVGGAHDGVCKAEGKGRRRVFIHDVARADASSHYDGMREAEVKGCRIFVRDVRVDAASRHGRVCEAEGKGRRRIARRYSSAAAGW